MFRNNFPFELVSINPKVEVEWPDWKKLKINLGVSLIGGISEL